MYKYITMQSTNPQSLALEDSQLQTLWDETCQQLTLESSSLLVDAWAKTSRLQKITDFENNKWLAIFVCPSSFNALQFEKNFAAAVKKSLANQLGRPVELKFIFNPLPASSTTLKTNSSVAPNPPVSPLSTPIQSLAHNTPALPSQTPQTSTFNDGLFSSSVVAQTIISRAATVARNLGLRPDFTFDTFAVSGSNEMALVAASSVAKSPGVSYNPLFLYGDVGVGKTHLMQSIGNYILTHKPEAKIIYCTGEEFTNSIIRAIQNKQALGFKDKFRTCEVLLIDDIQFIAGKTAVQEEFFHTFNALVKLNHQIVLTSDRPPHEIALLEDRLRSRFEAGLKIDIQQPSFELRSAILLTKAKAQNIDLSIELAQTIASRIDSARKLEGIIMRLNSEVELKNKLIDQELVNSILSEHQQREYSSRKLQPKEVLSAVANHYSIKQAVICGQKRQKEITLARHVAMFLLKSQLNLSYSEIGKIFSNRDHTSVLHAVTKINNSLAKDATLSQEVSAIKTSILGGGL